MNGCEKCAIYLAQNNLDEPDFCCECGKKTAKWHLDKGGCPIVNCSECGDILAVDMNMPCELDSSFHENVIIRIEAQKELLPKDVVVKLAKFFEMTSLQMHQKLKEGFTAEMSVAKTEKAISFLKSSNVTFSLENYVDFRRKYPFYKECRYPYSRMRIFKA